MLKPFTQFPCIFVTENSRVFRVTQKAYGCLYRTEEARIYLLNTTQERFSLKYLLVQYQLADLFTDLPCNFLKYKEGTHFVDRRFDICKKFNIKNLRWL